MSEAETIVREWANFHPDVPLTRTYADLVKRIEDALNQHGCEHCVCTCVNCAPCGSSNEE